MTAYSVEMWYTRVLWIHQGAWGSLRLYYNRIYTGENDYPETLIFVITAIVDVFLAFNLFFVF